MTKKNRQELEKQTEPQIVFTLFCNFLVSAETEAVQGNQSSFKKRADHEIKGNNCSVQIESFEKFPVVLVCNLSEYRLISGICRKRGRFAKIVTAKYR